MVRCRCSHDLDKNGKNKSFNRGSFSDETGAQFLTWHDLNKAPLDFNRLHALARAAVRLFGLNHPANHEHYLHIETAANVPRGSGGSSLVAAAIADRAAPGRAD